MDEQRTQQYSQPNEQLSGCPNGGELAILKAQLNCLRAELAELYLSQGKYIEAESLIKEALAIDRAALPENHPDLARNVKNLAGLYNSQGRYAEAEPLIKEALAIDRAALPENHPDLATAVNNLASLYNSQGRYAEAEPLFKEALAIDRIALPQNDPQIATHLNNLAFLYFSQSRYAEAELLIKEALATVRVALPENHPHIATCLNGLASLYFSQGRYAEAEPLIKEAIAIVRTALPENHPDLATYLNNLAELCKSQGRYAEADTLYKEAIAIVRIVLPENHPDLASYLDGLASLYLSQGRYTEAEPLIKEAIAIFRIALPNHPQTANALNNLGELYCNQGRYVEAEPLIKEALATFRTALAQNHPQIATALNNLANLYQFQGRDVEAETLYQEALAIVRIALPENHPQIAAALNSLANLYQLQGRYMEAEPFYQEAIPIFRIAFPENHPQIAAALNNLAEFYRNQGRYMEAEPLYKEALAIFRIALPENHPQIATALNNLAALHLSQGRYMEAEPLYEEALAIVRIALPENHPQIATTLNNLAFLYKSQGRYAEAEPPYKEALAIVRIALPEKHFNIAAALNNLAGLYFYESRYAEAEALYEEALAIVRIALPENHPHIASTLNNLGKLYEFQGRHAEALEQFQASLESEQQRLRYIFGNSSDRERREYLESNRNSYDAFLTLVWQNLRDDSQAVGAALDAVLRRKALTAAALAAQSEAIYSGRYPEEIKSLFRQWQDCGEKIVEAIYNPPPPNPDLSLEAKQRLQEDSRDRLTKLQDEAEELEKRLAKEIPELQLDQENVNRQVIAARLPEGSALVEFVRFRRLDFGASKGERWQEERYIAFAVMARQPERTILLDLGKAEALDKSIEVFRSYLDGAGDNLARHKPGFQAQKAKRELDEEQKLYQSLWQTLCQPLIDSLDSTSHWFLAPDSNLNLLPFQILPLVVDLGTTGQPAQGYFGDKYSISYLSAGRDLLRKDITDRPLKIRPATILADPDYDWDGKEAALRLRSGTRERGSRGESKTLVATLSGFDRAVGTDIFGRRVGEILGSQPYLDKNAVSYHLTDGDCPRILAIATHGFASSTQKPYFELIGELLQAKAGTETQIFQKHPSLMNSRLLEAVEQIAQYAETENPQLSQRLRDLTPKIQAYIQENPPSRLDAEDAEDAMYRAGVALAGANVWNRGGELPEGIKGVLLAGDIAALDLWGNELSALIACQSGLGEISSGEGVFGLRRAFVVAGSKTLVMSLWSVPARATSYLMERFFHYLNAGLGRAEALALAQSDVRTVTAGDLRGSDLGREILQELKGDYADGDCPLSHPYFWGAWVCQGDISPLQV